MEKLTACIVGATTILDTPLIGVCPRAVVCATRSALSAERVALCFFPLNSPISSLMELRGEFIEFQLCKLTVKVCPLCLCGIGARHAHDFAR